MLRSVIAVGIAAFLLPACGDDSGLADGADASQGTVERPTTTTINIDDFVEPSAPVASTATSTSSNDGAGSATTLKPGEVPPPPSAWSDDATYCENGYELFSIGNRLFSSDGETDLKTIKSEYDALARHAAAFVKTDQATDRMVDSVNGILKAFGTRLADATSVSAALTVLGDVSDQAHELAFLGQEVGKDCGFVGIGTATRF